MFLYDGSSVTNRYLVEAPAKGSGAGTRNIWLGGSLVAVVSDGQTWCLMADALGSVVAVTNPAGQAIKRNHYKPFGEVSSQGAQLPSADTAGFVGGLGVQADAATGMSYMWHRYYETETGRFVSFDPVARVPISLGLSACYRYAGNSPLRFVDAEGLTALFPSVSTVLEGACLSGVSATVALAGATVIVPALAPVTEGCAVATVVTCATWGLAAVVESTEIIKTLGKLITSSPDEVEEVTK